MLLKLKNIIIPLFISFFLSNSLFAETVNKKNILLLHSYHSGMTWVENINKAVNDTLTSELENSVLYIEYMDTKRHTSEEYCNTLKETYSKKYQNIKFDIILSSDNNAFDFLVKNRDTIFGDVPVSFCGVNGFQKKMIEQVTNFTGVAEQFSDKETIDTILKLHPHIKNIYIINDYLPTGQAWTQDMKKNLTEYTKKVNIIYADNFTLEELKNKIHSFDEDTVILLGVYFADKNKNYITYEKIGSYLLEGSNAPVYCLLNFNISSNIIGGKVIRGYAQGKVMSKVALRILNGTKTEDIPITFSEANEYIFNYKGLEKYKINQSLLPKNSTIINKSFSLYKQYKTILLNFILLFLLLSLLLILVIVYFHFKNRSHTINKDDLIISLIRFTPIFIIPLITVLIVWLLIHSVNKNHEQLKELERVEYINHMKKESKREVDRYIQIVKYSLSQAKNKTEIQTIKDNFIKMAQHIQYGKSGYIFIGSMEGYMVAHPNKTLIGKSFFDGKHEKAKDVFIQFKDKLTKDGSGFVEYNWTNFDSREEEKKITYVNLLAEFNWYVASGVYLDEVDRFIENKIKSSVTFDQKNINIIIISFIVLFIFSLIISIILSIVIKKAFNNYKRSILKEIKKSKIIEQSKKEFETIFKYAQDGIAIVDLNGNFLKFNKAFQMLTQYSEQELLNKDCDSLSAPEDREKNFLAIEKAKVQGHIDNFEKQCMIKGDKKITVHVSISLLPDKQSLLLMVKDASTIKDLEEQSRLASMGEMIGNIAHQWRQPLSVISTGATGMLVQKQFDVLSDEEFKQTCNTINDNAQYLSKTIDDFKNFIKNERNFVRFNLKQNIDSLLNLISPSLKQYNIELILNLDESIELDGYPNELIQCFMNIFNNSKDILKESSLEEKLIFIDTYKKEENIIISFKDNAGGIPDNILPKIFEPYFTTKHQTQGTGLGLSMTYNLITKGMDGTIEAQNLNFNHNGKLYYGAQFEITLPFSN